MSDISTWHWLIVIIWISLIGWPAAKILHRLGFSRWWTAVALLPWINIIGLWVLAFIRWKR